MDTDELGQPIVIMHPGDPVAGGWCPTRLLPSVVRVPLYVLSPPGVSLWQIIQGCAEHGGYEHLGQPLSAAGSSICLVKLHSRDSRPASDFRSG
jgi:hypothetical protein